MAQLSMEEASRLVVRALRNAGAGQAMAASTANALVRAEAQGLASHGLSRVPQYTTHLRNGRAEVEDSDRVGRLGARGDDVRTRLRHLHVDDRICGSGGCRCVVGGCRWRRGIGCARCGRIQFLGFRGL